MRHAKVRAAGSSREHRDVSVIPTRECACVALPAGQRTHVDSIDTHGRLRVLAHLDTSIKEIQIALSINQ